MEKTKFIKLNELVNGDTIINLKGEKKTFNENWLKECPFFGCTLQGDRYKNNEIEVALYPKWLKGEIINYVTQP